uniref:RING-type domain-containing protein n=1 Tax=Homalodisca liturata TaxID=320908 RepID=A0A1B6HBN1_9HEMI
MSNFYHELDVETVLQCPVCFELPSNVIFVCKVGHHMCEKCRKRLTTCPTCQSALTSTRNFLAEALISKFSIFRGGGDAPFNNNSLPDSGSQRVQPDSSTSVVGELPENLGPLRPLPMSSGLYTCLLESCRNRGPIANGCLYKHIEVVHAHLFDKFQNKVATFTHNFDNFCKMKGRGKYHRAFHVSNMGIFYLCLEILEDGYLNCWLSAPIPLSRANCFQYQIQFSKENDDAKVTFCSKMGSNLLKPQWLFERGRVMIIPPTVTNLNMGEFFSFSVKIVYRPPAPTPLTTTS